MSFPSWKNIYHIDRSVAGTVDKCCRDSSISGTNRDESAVCTDHSPTEMIAIVTVNINIGGVEGLMNICLPYLTLEDVMDKLNTKYWFSTMQDRDETSYADVIETAINRALIPVSAELGKAHSPLWISLICRWEM